MLEEEAGRVVAVRELRYRDLPLKSARGGELPEGAAAEKLLPLLAALPWKWLGEQKECKRVIARARWLRERVPDLELPDWTMPRRRAPRSTCSVARRTCGRCATQGRDVLLAWLQPTQRRALQQLAPDRIELPTGRAAVVS